MIIIINNILKYPTFISYRVQNLPTAASSPTETGSARLVLSIFLFTNRIHHDQLENIIICIKKLTIFLNSAILIMKIIPIM
jgi:hypothetical protein